MHTSVKKISDFKGIPLTKKKFFNPNIAHNPISFLLSIVGIFVMLYIGVTHLNDPDPLGKAYANYSLLLAFLGFIGYVVMDVLDDGHITIIPNKLLSITDYFEILLKTFVIFVSILVVQFFFAFSVEYALSDTEMVLYFVFAGVCEELFFRVTLVGGLIALKDRFDFKINKHLYNIVIVSVSSFIFMCFHLEVYGSDVAILLSVLVCGFVLGIAYAYWNDISANMMSHIFINIIAVRSLLVTYAIRPAKILISILK